MEDIMDRQPSVGEVQVTQLYQSDSTATWRKSAAGHHTKTSSFHSFPPYFFTVFLLHQICSYSVLRRTQTLEVYLPFCATREDIPDSLLLWMNSLENIRGSFHAKRHSLCRTVVKEESQLLVSQKHQACKIWNPWMPWFPSVTAKPKADRSCRYYIWSAKKYYRYCLQCRLMVNDLLIV